jgi:ectoine hydroxylase-related dioxygenase (phytanoyl-CoA dioxygenase family)
MPVEVRSASSAEADKSDDACFFSCFGGLWTDRTDAAEVVAGKLARGEINLSEHDDLIHFMKHGFLIKERAANEDLISAFEHDLDKVYSGTMPRKMTYWDKDGQHRLEKADRKFLTERECKLIDIHSTSAAAQDLIFAPTILRFLTLVFEDTPLAFQSLQFYRGSEQGIHQDTAFVPIAGAPLEFVATWIALEDVNQGSGELLYVPGSHHLPELTFTAGGKECPPGDSLLSQYTIIVRKHYEDAGLKVSAFLPKRGDVLFWAADLAHGGAEITDDNLTRRSLVTHYCPASRLPGYAARPGPFEKRLTRSGGYVISQT